MPEIYFNCSSITNKNPLVKFEKKKLDNSFSLYQKRIYIHLLDDFCRETFLRFLKFYLHLKGEFVFENSFKFLLAFILFSVTQKANKDYDRFSFCTRWNTSIHETLYSPFIGSTNLYCLNLNKNLRKMMEK